MRQIFERRVLKAGARQRETLLAGAAAAAKPLLSGQPTAGPASDTSFAVLHGLYWLAANMAAARPLVMVVDDAHWADGPTLRWLAYLAPRVEGLRLTVLIALRPAEPAAEAPSLLTVREAATIVRPELLSERAAAEVVRSLAGGDATDELCSRMWRVSGGNPYYLRELLRSPVAEGTDAIAA